MTFNFRLRPFLSLFPCKSPLSTVLLPFLCLLISAALREEDVALKRKEAFCANPFSTFEEFFFFFLFFDNKPLNSEEEVKGESGALYSAPPSGGDTGREALDNLTMVDADAADAEGDEDARCRQGCTALNVSFLVSHFFFLKQQFRDVSH